MGNVGIVAGAQKKWQRGASVMGNGRPLAALPVKKGSAGGDELGNVHLLAGAQKRGRLAAISWVPLALWPTAKNCSFFHLLPQRYELCFGQLLSNRRAVIQPAAYAL